MSRQMFDADDLDRNEQAIDEAEDSEGDAEAGTALPCRRCHAHTLDAAP